MDAEGKRRCGGEGCDGLVGLASGARQKAKDFEKDIVSAMEEVEKLSKLVSCRRIETAVKFATGVILFCFINPLITSHSVPD